MNDSILSAPYFHDEQAAYEFVEGESSEEFERAMDTLAPKKLKLRSS